MLILHIYFVLERKSVFFPPLFMLSTRRLFGEAWHNFCKRPIKAESIILTSFFPSKSSLGY